MLQESERMKKVICFLKEEIKAAHADFLETADMDAFYDGVTLMETLKAAEFGVYAQVKTNSIEELMN